MGIFPPPPPPAPIGALGSQMLTATLAYMSSENLKSDPCTALQVPYPRSPLPSPNDLLWRRIPNSLSAPPFGWITTAPLSCYSKPLWCHFLCWPLRVSPGEEMHFFLNAHGDFIARISCRLLICPVYYYLLFLFLSHIINGASVKSQPCVLQIICHSPLCLRLTCIFQPLTIHTSTGYPVTESHHQRYYVNRNTELRNFTTEYWSSVLHPLKRRADGLMLLLLKKEKRAVLTLVA